MFWRKKKERYSLIRWEDGQYGIKDNKKNQFKDFKGSYFWKMNSNYIKDCKTILDQAKRMYFILNNIIPEEEKYEVIEVSKKTSKNKFSITLEYSKIMKDWEELQK
jgi:hypothetical protein